MSKNPKLAPINAKRNEVPARVNATGYPAIKTRHTVKNIIKGKNSTIDLIC